MFEVITMQNKVGCISQHFWMCRLSNLSKKHEIHPSSYIVQKLNLILRLQEYSKWQNISTNCTFGELPIEIMSGVMISTPHSCRSEPGGVKLLFRACLFSKIILQGHRKHSNLQSHAFRCPKKKENSATI